MRIYIFCFLFLPLLLLLFGGCGQTSEFIAVDGSRLVDSSGEDFSIKGIYVGNWLNLEGYMWSFDGSSADRQSRIEAQFSRLLGEDDAREFWDSYRDAYITEQDIEAMAEMGFNTVKVPLHWNFLMETEPTVAFKESGFKTLDRLLRWCDKYGMHVVFDLHSAPGGQLGSNIDDSPNNEPELFMNPVYQEQTVRLWGEIVRRYADNDTILAYDLLDEPLSGRKGEPYYADLEPLMKRITAEIRKYDNNHIISVQGPLDVRDWSLFGEPFDDKLLYQFHLFSVYPNTELIQPFLDFRDTYDVPIWCGGFGENRNSNYRQTLDLLDEHHIGWSFWSWKKMTGTNNPVSLPPVRNWSKIQSFVKGQKELSPEEGKEILFGMLEDCAFENCTINQEVVDTLLPPENKQE